MISASCVNGMGKMWIICKHFPIASEMRSLVVCLFGIHWVMTLRVMDLLSSWQGSFGWHRNAEIWKIVPHCLIRCIRRERNARSFESCEQSIIELKSFFFLPLLDWVKALQALSCNSFSDLLELCLLRC